MKGNELHTSESETRHLLCVFDQTIMKVEPMVRVATAPECSGPAHHSSMCSKLVSTKPVMKHQGILLNHSKELLRKKTGYARWRGLSLFKSNIFKVQPTLPV